MKIRNLVCFARPLLPCAIMLGLGAYGTQGAVGNGTVASARVVHLKGAARYTTGGSAWQRLQVGDVLQPGSIIETGTKSRLDLDVKLETAASEPDARPQQHTIRVWENSRLGIGTLTCGEAGGGPVAVNELDLQAGHISGTSRGLPADSRFEVKIPSAVASIRAGTYDISAEGEIKARAGFVLLEYIDPGEQVGKQVIIGYRTSSPYPPAS